MDYATMDYAKRPYKCGTITYFWDKNGLTTNKALLDEIKSLEGPLDGWWTCSYIATEKERTEFEECYQDEDGDWEDDGEAMQDGYTPRTTKGVKQMFNAIRQYGHTKRECFDAIDNAKTAIKEALLDLFPDMTEEETVAVFHGREIANTTPVAVQQDERMRLETALVVAKIALRKWKLDVLEEWDAGGAVAVKALVKEAAERLEKENEIERANVAEMEAVKKATTAVAAALEAEDRARNEHKAYCDWYKETHGSEEPEVQRARAHRAMCQGCY